MGVGELLLTSVDKEGMMSGYDIELVKLVSANIEIPIIASGGMGKLNDLLDVILIGGADAASMASITHYNKENLTNIRNYAISNKINVRNFDEKKSYNH